MRNKLRKLIVCYDFIWRNTSYGIGMYGIAWHVVDIKYLHSSAESSPSPLNLIKERAWKIGGTTIIKYTMGGVTYNLELNLRKNTKKKGRKKKSIKCQITN
ncbi:hypothetical protein S83_071466 [Arachis hypogaea]